LIHALVEIAKISARVESRRRHASR